jgi:hypothetical protein
MGKSVGSQIKLGSLAPTIFGQLDKAHPAILLAGLHHNQTLFFKRAQQAADVSRIEREPPSQFPNFRTLFSDLPQEPRFTEGMVAAQEVIVEYPYTFGHGPVEAANPFN